jgi:hypothetical protein
VTGLTPPLAWPYRDAREFGTALASLRGTLTDLFGYEERFGGGHKKFVTLRRPNGSTEPNTS